MPDAGKTADTTSDTDSDSQLARKSSKGEAESSDSRGKMSKFAKRLNRFMPKVAKASTSSRKSSVDDSSSCNSHDMSTQKKECFPAVANDEEESGAVTTDNFELEDQLLAAFEGSIPPMSSDGMIFDDQEQHND